MKRFLSLALALFMVLSMMPQITIGASAADHTGGRVYFETDWNVNCVQLMIGHSGWSQGYQMTKESGNLYYVDVPGWNGAWDFAVFGTESVWGGESNSIANRKSWALQSTGVDTSGYQFETGKKYLITSTGTDNISVKVVYDVTVTETANGTVVADKTLVGEDETVTLTVNADDGYELDTLTVKQGETDVTVTDNAFTMPAGNVTITATFKAEQTCEHTSHDTDGVCSSCGESVAHEFEGSICKICNFECPHESHYTSGSCTTCNAVNVAHTWVNDTCSGCKAVCGTDVAHNWGEGVCQNCSATCEHTASHTTEGVCSACGGTVEHQYGTDGKCACGLEHQHEKFDDHDTCNGCGYVCPHENYTEGVCAVCGKADSTGSVEPDTYAAVIGETPYTTFDEAITAANAMTGDVTVAIYGRVEYSSTTADLTGAYDSISFVGKTDDAEISITRDGSGGYISGQGNDCTVNFSNLILSKPTGAYANDAGFMNVYFTVYRVGTVNYTNCTFPDGACAQGCPVNYSNCNFANQTSGEYSLWVYADTTVTVENSQFTGVRGAKMYGEGAAKTGNLVMKNTTFSESVTQKPAIVLTYGESVTLEDNTYPATGVFELDKDGDPNGTPVTSTDAITCVNDYGACGVLVDGKIYTTVAQAAEVATSGSTVTLLHASTETVELAEGVTLNKNSYTAENVTVVEPAAKVAYIGETGYETVEAAFAAAEDGDEVKINVAGTYKVPSGKDITVTGTVDGVMFDDIGAHNMGGANVTFNNVTFDYLPNTNYTGLQAAGNLEYNNCIINGTVFLYGASETFNNCTFNVSGDAYNVWTYGAKEVKFDGCTFNSDGKSVLVYNEGACATNLTVTDCDFIADSSFEGKAAIEIDTSLMPGSTNIVIDSATTVTGFDEGSKSGSTLWNNKKGNDTEANNDITVTVGGEVVLQPIDLPTTHEVSTKAALDAAIAAAEAGDVILLTADIDYGTTQLAITKAITLNLGGHTLTTGNTYGGMSLKNGPSIKNGTIVHNGTVAAIKAWDVASIEDVTITVAYKAGKTIGGIVIQENAAGIDTIKNVTINGEGLTNGIETYNCGNATEPVIGSMENVTIDAVGTGMLISAPCGTATNCTIEGGTNGIEIWIKGTYSASLNLVDCDVIGGVYAHDEFTSVEDAVNSGTLSLTADAATTGASADDIALTIARAEKVEGVLKEVKENAVAMNGNTYYTSLAAAVADASSGDTVTMLEDVTITASQTNGYGKTGIKLDAGITLDGNDHKLTVTGANGTWDSAISMTGGEVKNLTIAGAFRGVFMPGANGDVVIDTCVFEDVVYTFNSDAGSKDYSVTIKNSTLNGWTSYSNVHKSVTFENCSFGKGSGYAYLRPYQATTFNGCTFADGYEVATNQTADNTLVFNNCTYAGEALSQENGAGLFASGKVMIDGKSADFNPPNGTVTPAYTTTDRFWGEARSNSKKSLVIELYEGETKIGSSTLDSSYIVNQADGSTYVTWNLKFSGTGDAWTYAWAEGYPKYDMNPDTVKLVVDGTEVATNVVKWSAADDLNKIVAVVGNEDGTLVGYYTSVADALAAANDKGTVELIAGESVISMAGAVYGKTVTITGTAIVDWSKGNLFVGRGGEGNGTVIFDNATLTSNSDNASTGIHVSGREKDTDNKYDGTLIIKNSTIELDYLINKGTMTLDNSTLTVKNGFSVGGRPASETESGKDATATLTLNNSSKLVVGNHNGMGLGYEALGVMNIDSTSTFETTQAFLITEKGTMNVSGTVKIAGILTNNGAIKMATDSALNATSVVGSGEIAIDAAKVAAAAADTSVQVIVGDATAVAEKITLVNGLGVEMKVTEEGVTLTRKNTVAANGDVDYKTVQEAIAAAAVNETDKTVVLLCDVSDAGTVVVNGGVTLDLDGYSLTADYVAAFSGSHVVDSNPEKGLLIVPQNSVMLQENNSQMPVYTGEGYVFAVLNLSYEKMESAEGLVFKSKFKPSFGSLNATEYVATKYLADGAADNGIQIIIRLSWMSNGSPVKQDFLYTEELIQEVYSATNVVFTLGVTSLASTADVTAQVVVVSDTGVEAISTGNTYSAN